jgi:hypothetical protein
MTKKQIEERIEYLKMEIAHSKHHDGYTLKGMKEEIKWLEEQLCHI